MKTIKDRTTTTVGEAAEAFRSNLVRKQAPEGTLKQYLPVLRALTAWADNRSVGDLTARDLDRFLSCWISDFEERNGRRPSGHSIKTVIVALRSMYRYLERFGILVDGSGVAVPNPSLALEVPSIPQKVNDWLRETEDDTLLACEMSDSEAALIWILRWTGLRLSEALSMRISDIDFVGNTMYVRAGKTARSRRGIPILPELRPALNRWLTVLRERGLYLGNGPLFPTRTMKPWTATQAQRIVARVGRRAGLRIDDKGICRLTPHTLRRTHGSSLLNRGVRLEVVSRLLGHASTSVTERAYAELLDQTIRREVYAAFA